jgi:hypothetical protein
MVSGRLLEKYLFQNRSQRPLRGFLRNIFYSLAATAIAATLIVIMESNISWKYLLGIFFISAGIFFFGWGAERLWYASISKMAENPFSKFAYLTRIPFWFASGGIGLSLPVLFGYKWGLIYISVDPQSNLFIWGGIIGCLIQVPLQLNIYKFLVKKVDTF